MKPRTRKIYWVIAAVVILLILFVFINPSLRALFMNLFHLRTIAEVRSYVDSLGAWGPMIMISLMVVHSVTFVPSEIIMVADVGLFGPVWGIVYSWVGSMLGAYLSFFFTRWIGLPIAKRFVPEPLLNRFDAYFEEKGVWGVFLLRLIPLVSFNALNYATGLTRMTIWQFTWSTGLGILPSGILFALLYHSVTGQKFAFVGLTIVGVVLLINMIVKAKFSKQFR